MKRGKRLDFGSDNIGASKPYAAGVAGDDGEEERVHDADVDADADVVDGCAGEQKRWRKLVPDQVVQTAKKEMMSDLSKRVFLTSTSTVVIVFIVDCSSSGVLLPIVADAVIDKMW